MTYPRPLRLIHWTVAILVTCQLALAVVLTQLRSLSYGQLVLSLHRELGLVILLLVLTRLVLSRWHKAPSYSGSSLPTWQVRAAGLVHVGFLVLLVAQPIVGMLVAWGRGDAVSLLGLVNIPAPLEMPDTVRERLMSVHAGVAVLLFSLCLLHIGAVVFNRVVRRVSVIDRMLSPRPTERLVNRLPVGSQLALAFSVVIGVALIVGINAIATYRSLNVATAAFQNGDLAVTDQLRAAQVAWKDYAALVGSGATDADALKSAADTAKSSLEDAQTHVPAGDVQSGIVAAIAQMTAAAGPTTHADVLKAIDARLQDLVDSQSVVNLQDRSNYDELAARGHDLIVVTLLPMMVAALMVGVILAHSITGSLDRMDALIKSIEADQRSSTIEVLGAGQFAGLTRDIIAMRVAVESRANTAAARQAALEAESSRLAREKLQQDAEAAHQQRIARQVQREQLAAEFELQVSGIISTVSEAARTFTTTAGAMASTAATSTQRSSDARMVAEQASHTATEVATGTSDLAVKAESVRENAAQSKTRASSAVQEAELANTQIQHLLEAVRQISSITDLIAAVARQTNLLAINARIEAARAGELGLGFSVVADEVKALARRTGEATDGIEKHIQQIDAAAARSSESLRRLLEVIAGVDQAASEIVAVTDAQVASTRQLTEHMSGISSSTRSVAVDIRDAQETAHETERMSADMVQTAAVIGEQADRLRDQIGLFVLNLRSAGAGARDSNTVALSSTPDDASEYSEQQPWRAVAS